MSACARACPYRSDDGVAFFEAKHAEQAASVHGRKERIDFEAKLVGEFVKVGAATMVCKNFEQAGQVHRGACVEA